MNQLVFIENGRPVTDSQIVANAFDKNHADVLRDIRNLGCSEEFRLSNFAESYYVNHQGRKMPRMVMTEAGFTLLAMGYTGQRAMEFKEQYISEFNRMRFELNKRQQPQSIEDLIIMQAQSVKELKSKVENLSLQLQVQSHRIDTMDAVNTVGDMQQRLNAMIRKYAKVNGLTFQQAYREFRAAYNMAYRTNITALIDNYKERYGLRELSMPEYLAHTGMLEDAIRVADKMLNPVGV